MRTNWKEKAIKAENYISTYGERRGTCMGCGEYVHARYICAHCRLDNSDIECFQTWVENELERQSNQLTSLDLAQDMAGHM